MMNKEGPPADDIIPQSSIITPTATAVMAHKNELCSRNMVLSAYTLLQQQESNDKMISKHRNPDQGGGNLCTNHSSVCFQYTTYDARFSTSSSSVPPSSRLTRAAAPKEDT